jgi:hypothetical protein
MSRSLRSEDPWARSSRGFTLIELLLVVVLAPGDELAGTVGAVGEEPPPHAVARPHAMTSAER